MEMELTKMLKKNYEFKNVLSKGKFYVGKKIKIVILNNKKDNNYLGIAIGTKNGGKPVDSNFIPLWISVKPLEIEVTLLRN